MGLLFIMHFWLSYLLHCFTTPWLDVCSSAVHLYLTSLVHTLDVDALLDISHEIHCTSPYLLPRRRARLSSPLYDTAPSPVGSPSPVPPLKLQSPLLLPSAMLRDGTAPAISSPLSKHAAVPPMSPLTMPLPAPPMSPLSLSAAAPPVAHLPTPHASEAFLPTGAKQHDSPKGTNRSPLYLSKKVGVSPLSMSPLSLPAVIKEETVRVATPPFANRQGFLPFPTASDDEEEEESKSDCLPSPMLSPSTLAPRSPPTSPKNMAALMAGFVTMGTLAIVRSPRIIARKDFAPDRQVLLSSLCHAARSGDLLMATGANLVSSGIRAGMNGKVSHIAVIWVDPATDCPYIAHSTNHDFHPSAFRLDQCKDYFVGKVINGVQMTPLLPYLAETCKHEHQRYIWRPLCSTSMHGEGEEDRRLPDVLQAHVDDRLRCAIRDLHARPWPSHLDIWQRYHQHGHMEEKPGDPESMLCNEFVVTALRAAGILDVAQEAWLVLPTVFEQGSQLDQSQTSMMHPDMRYGPEHYITYDLP